jgi:lipopolysaccharide transport system ATP-binding protein
MSQVMIEVDNLSKLYELGTIGSRTLQESLERRWYRLRGKEHQLRKVGAKRQMIGPDHPQAGPRPNTMWALKDVSLTVKEGEVLGIIGRNGAGKSTLLKILTRITEPTYGSAWVYGRVASLLEVGTGFHPELTGRDNIYLNGAILGMKKAEIARKFDEIVAFAEVEKFIDTPVKRYSSGMYVRLAFAVAAHLEPEILLVDEVLAVGDASFQKKCLGKMGDVAREGRTIMFVSHNMPAIQALCGRACIVDGGRAVLVDEASAAVDHYLRSSRETMATVSIAERADRTGSGDMRFTHVTLLDDSGHETPVAKSGGELVMALDYVRREGSDSCAVVRMAFSNDQGQRLFMCISRTSAAGALRLSERGRIECRIPRLPLIPGTYTVGVWCKLGEAMADCISNAFVVDVAGGDYFGTGKLNQSDGGNLLVEHDWKVV